MKVITVRDTPPYGHAPTYQLSLTYLERQKCYGQDKKILFKKQLFDLEVKGQGPTKIIMVRNTPPYGHAPTYEISLTYLERQKSYGLDKLRWEEAKEKNQTKTMSPFVRREDIIRSLIYQAVVKLCLNIQNP